MTRLSNRSIPAYATLPRDTSGARGEIFREPRLDRSSIAVAAKALLISPSSRGRTLSQLRSLLPPSALGPTSSRLRSQKNNRADFTGRRK